GKRIGMELLKEAILKESFPSWSGQESFAFVKVNYRISGLRINTVDFPETSASFIPGTGISLSVTRASATMSADWGLKTWLLENCCSFPPSQFSCPSIFSHLSSSSESSFFTISKMPLPLAKQLQVLICFCNNIHFVLSIILLVLSQIDAFAQIDYSLVSSPAVFKSHLNLDLKVIFYAVGNHRDPPFMPAPFALPNQGDSMLYLGVSNYFLKSASLAYYKAGIFNLTISQEVEVSRVRKQQSEALRMVQSRNLPYGTGESQSDLRLMATETPIISLQQDSFTLEIQGSMEVFAVLPDSSTQSLFTMSIVSMMKEATIHSDLNVFISLLENILSYILQTEVIPSANGEAAFLMTRHRGRL
uniref:Bactericidal permeability-increasing protein n=1 Tax=Nothoprocta perdicaria TaxID=30464 RepID=A0A8C6ZZC1_NOTPE